MNSPGAVVVAGSLAQKPHRGGHTWVLLQYLLGLRRLGWQVMFLDRLEPEMCRNAADQQCDVERSINMEYFVGIMRENGFDDAYSLDYHRGQKRFGLSRAEVLNRTRDADCLLDVMGFLDDSEILGAARLRVFLDVDPGFSHMWQDLGLADLFTGYDRYVTIARNLGRKECSIPTCALDWITTSPPVVLESWPFEDISQPLTFTTIGAWRGRYDPVEYRGVLYGLRVHEFRKFAALPQLTGKTFRVALDIHEADRKDRELLVQSGWSLTDPLEAASSPRTYGDYIRHSGAEIMISKGMYVQSNSGWFSDRSVCYLASGRPVLAQDTGFGRYYPTGEGIVSFTTLEEAAQGVESISSDPQRHSRAARGIAEEYFDSDKVLSSLIDQVGSC